MSLLQVHSRILDNRDLVLVAYFKYIAVVSIFINRVRPRLDDHKVNVTRYASTAAYIYYQFYKVGVSEVPEMCLLL